MKQNVAEQYKTSDNLRTRISIHEKYSINKQPFGDWILSNYRFEPRFRILELGCGTADMWRGRLDVLPKGSQLLLSDFSQGMLESARRNLAADERLCYRVIDIQDIPYADESFDAVIANMMLYHVPDLQKALAEVRRVLKPGGIFYAATYGEHGIMEFINDALRDHGIHGEIGKAFTLQNGTASLKHHFETVRIAVRTDALAVTCVSDFVDYTMSLSSLSGLKPDCRDSLRESFEAKVNDGILYIPKEYGMFICK